MATFLLASQLFHTLIKVACMGNFNHKMKDSLIEVLNKALLKIFQFPKNVVIGNKQHTGTLKLVL